MSRVTTKILKLTHDGDAYVVAVRPLKWTDEQWAKLITENAEYYRVDLVEEDWSYGE